jgi:hypothetical protein
MPPAIRYVKFFRWFGWTYAQVRSTPSDVLTMCEIYMGQLENDSEFPPGFDSIR